MCKIVVLSLIYIRAASNGEIEILKYLISKGCKVDVPTKLGRCALSKACWNGRVDVVDILV
jgi:ankyrin repeat protein